MYLRVAENLITAMRARKGGRAWHYFGSQVASVNLEKCPWMITTCFYLIADSTYFLKNIVSVLDFIAL